VACFDLELTSETMNTFRHFGRIPWTEDQPTPRPLPTQDSITQRNVGMHLGIEWNSNPRPQGSNGALDNKATGSGIVTLYLRKYFKLLQIIINTSNISEFTCKSMPSLIAGKVQISRNESNKSKVHSRRN